MEITATMFEAKTNLSALVKRAQAGETIIITSGREKKPVAQLSAVERRRPKRLGVCYNPNFKLPSDFFEPDLDGEA